MLSFQAMSSAMMSTILGRESVRESLLQESANSDRETKRNGLSSFDIIGDNEAVIGEAAKYEIKGG